MQDAIQELLDAGMIAKLPNEDKWWAHYFPLDIIFPQCECTNKGLPKTMLVWRFHDAPWQLKSLSENGGDDDFLTFIPYGIEWDCSPAYEQYNLPDGSKVIVGHHPTAR